MTKNINERLQAWLEDAYSMEQEAETMLKAMGSRIEHYPELKARIELHITETQGQMGELERCLESIGGSKPTAKAAFASAMAAMHATGNAMMSDEVAKGVGISYAFEQMEIATYRALVIAAKRAGNQGVADTCERILAQEEEMAKWLLGHQPAVIERFLEREAADVEAKR